RNALRVPGDADHAALVDLQHVRLEQDETLQATVPEADVVDGNEKARRVQRADRLDQVGRITDDLLLADLQAERVAGQRRREGLDQMLRGHGDQRGRKDVQVKPHVRRELRGGGNAVAETEVIDRRQNVSLRTDAEEVVRHLEDMVRVA